MKLVKKIINKLVLKKALYECDIRYNKLGAEIAELHKKIMNEIRKGNKVELLRLEIHKLYEERSSLISKKYDIASKIDKAA